MMVKGNQPQLSQMIEAALSPVSFDDRRPTSVEESDWGHGRAENRKLTVTSLLSGWEEWPGIQQVFSIERWVYHPKSRKRHHERVLGMTSLTAEEASPSVLLGAVRAHWLIENRSHCVRDVTFDEDRSQVRRGNIPQVMAAIRNTAIGLLRLAGFTNIAAGCRYHAAKPFEAAKLIGALPRTE